MINKIFSGGFAAASIESLSRSESLEKAWLKRLMN
jgi:hypothetical protein